MMWTTDVLPQVIELSLDEVDALTASLDIQSWPVVLGVTARQATVAERNAAIAVGAESLAARGLLEAGEPIDDLVLAVRALTHPDVEVEIRFTDPETTAVRRVSLCRNASRNSLALRRGDVITVQAVDITSTDMLAGRVADLLGDEDVVTIDGISAPTDELGARLDRCRSATDVAQTLHALGANEADTTAAALAFAECRARVEIVACEFVEGNPTQSSGAVAVYSTPRGRMVTSPSKSSDGRSWTTISPGTSHRIKQAVTRLIETLPSGRWTP